ncbi:MAG: PAS domain-containing sensor histidine kinase [Hyphomicrobiales bacterium]|nr:PAS domain-containing sensor histidine kinase [Hyphomicrobiales bacterium]
MQMFVAARLGFTVIVLLCAPAWVALTHPTLWQAFGFLFLMSPFCAVLALSRGASRRTAHTISMLGLLLFAVTMIWGGALTLAFAAVMLIVIDAATAGDMRFVIAADLAAGAIFVAASAMLGGEIAAPISPYLRIGVFAVVLAYGAFLGLAVTSAVQVARTNERRASLRHEALAGVLGDLVMRHDRSGSVLSATAESHSLFNLSPRDLMGRGLFERIHVADRPSYLTTVADAADAVDTDMTRTVVLRLRRGADAEENAFVEPVFAWVEMRLRRLPDERRATDPQDSAAVIAIMRDVTKAKIAEHEIIEARSNAERANVWKDRFLANVSHELRTPLNAIIGFSEILSSTELTPKDPAQAREYAGIIRSSGQHLLEVVNSILDVSKIDAGTFDICPEPFAPSPLLDQCCDMMSLRAEKGGVKIQRDYTAALPEISADKRACKQIIINLLSNAVKFTPAGGTVTVSARPEGALFAIEITDTGVGIGASDLKHVGDPFFQAQSAANRGFEGTGLGLSLVRGLVGLHGGSIALESAPGQGSRFTVCLPAEGGEPDASRKLARIETSARAPHGLPAKRENLVSIEAMVKKSA